MIATVAGYALGFFFWMIATRFYAADEVGSAVTLISAMTLLAGSSKLGFEIGIIRFLPNEKDKQGLINSCITIIILFSITLVLIFISGLNIWSPTLLFIRENPIYLFSFMLFTVVTAVLLFQYSLFVSFRKARFSFFQNISWMTLKIPLLLIFVTFGTLGIFFSWGIAICIVLIISIFILIPINLAGFRPIPSIRKKMIKDMMHFSFGNYIAGIFFILPNTVLPIMIANVFSSEKTAYFFIGWTIAGILYMIPYAITTSIFVEGSYEPKEFKKNAIKGIKLILLLLILAITGIILFGDKLLLLFGHSYSENATEMLYVLAISSIPITFNTLYITKKRVEMKVKPIIYIYAFIALFTLGGGYILAMKYGLFGIGFGWTLSQFIVLVLIGLSKVKKTLNLKSEKK